MKILGINCMNHDASMSVVDYSSGIGEVLWAAHAERYSKVKNDHLPQLEDSKRSNDIWSI